MVVYGVNVGLCGLKELNPFKLKELVFFKIDFGNDEAASCRFLACGGSISSVAICLKLKISGAGRTSNLEGLRCFCSNSNLVFSSSSLAL